MNAKLLIPVASAIMLLTGPENAVASGPPSARSPRFHRPGKAPPIISLYVPEPERKNNAFRLAAREGRLERLRALMGDGARINGRSPEGQTALMYAAKYCRPKTVTLLISLGAKIDLADDKGRTALIHATRNSCVRSVRVLLSHRAKPGVRDGSGRTALRYARKRAVVEVGGPDSEIVSLLLHASASRGRL
jgi:ankyrin repeat protein